MSSIKDVFSSLESLENGKEMIEVLKAELASINKESAKRRIEKKEILEALGLTDSNSKDELTEIKNMINNIKSNGGDPLTISTKLEALTKQVQDLTKANEEAEKAKIEEYNKRVNQAKFSKALEVLTANNANNPSVISKLIIDNLDYDQETDTLNYLVKDKDNKDSHISVEEGIKAFLKENPYLVKNTQNSGSGKSINNSTNNIKNYTLDDIKNMSAEEINKNWQNIRTSLN